VTKQKKRSGGHIPFAVGCFRGECFDGDTRGERFKGNMAASFGAKRGALSSNTSLCRVLLGELVSGGVRLRRAASNAAAADHQKVCMELVRWVHDSIGTSGVSVDLCDHAVIQEVLVSLKGFMFVFTC